MCFSQNGALREKFASLYASLFKHSENHKKTVESLARKTKGMTREEIIAATKLSDGGGLSKTLEELEQCGFIRRYNAFEQVCAAHIKQIKNRLGISGVRTHTASWRSKKSDPRAQVDLLIDRNDQVINLCEMKYSHTEFTIDKKYDEILLNKKDAFIQETKTQKTVHLTMVTTYGIKRNEYAGNIQSEVKMDDLFR